MRENSKVNAACLWACTLYGYETWYLQRRLERAEMQKARIMCGATLKDKVPIEFLRRNWELHVECSKM
jgi:hypothetical protein